jgi:hypothetical protein
MIVDFAICGDPLPVFDLQDKVEIILTPDTTAPAPAVAPAPVVTPAPAPLPEPVAAVPTGRGNTFVLVVGCDSYDDPAIPKLRFAEADAREVYGFFSNDPKSPTDPDRVERLYGQAATRTKVLSAIREQLQAKALKPEDTAILYFAGHGFADKSGTYLACRDTSLASLPETAISVDTLADYWGRIEAGHKVLLLDACHSGGASGVRGIGGVSIAPRAPERAGAGTLTIAAAGENELSTEDEDLGHGLFTTALVKGLRGAADANQDGRVTGLELGRFVTSEVERLAARANARQHPVVTSSPGAPIVYLTR